MENHTDIVDKCQEREKSFRQGVLTDLMEHYRQVVDHMRQEVREAEDRMKEKAKTLANKSDKKSCSQALQNAIRENDKMEGELKKKISRKMWSLKHPRPRQDHQERPFKRRRTESTSSQQSSETCHTDESIPQCVRPNKTVYIPRQQHETPQTKHRRRVHRRTRHREKTIPADREDQTILTTRRSVEHERIDKPVDLEPVKPLEVDIVPHNTPVELCANETTVSVVERTDLESNGYGDTAAGTVTGDGAEPYDQNAKSIAAKTRKYVVNRSRHVLTESELSVLNKGLTFVPTEPYANRNNNDIETGNMGVIDKTLL